SVALVDDGDRPPLAARAELDAAVARGEDRVVAADARAGAGAETRPALADEDHARLDFLPVEELHAEPLPLRVAPVLRGTETFLVCHPSSSPSAFSADSSAASAPFRFACCCSYSSAASSSACSQPFAAAEICGTVRSA